MKLRNSLLMLAAVLISSASISAQYSHTWVSGNGSNFNPCTFAAPCLTFQSALANTTPGGMISAKDPGDFGQLTINQPVTIDGANMGSIIFNGSSSTGINITTSGNVTVQNLTINGMGTGYQGINAVNGGVLFVNNCNIMNLNAGVAFGGAGSVTIENSRIESLFGAFYGIHISGSAAEDLVVRNTVIDASPASNGNVGLLIDSGAGPVTASLQNVTIKGAGAGAVMAASGVTQITGSVITKNNYGVYAFNGSTISVASSLITSNTTGVCSNASSKIRLDNNDIYDNPTAIGNCGGIVKTSTTNKTSGTIAIPTSDVSDSVTF